MKTPDLQEYLMEHGILKNAWAAQMAKEIEEKFFVEKGRAMEAIIRQSAEIAELKAKLAASERAGAEMREALLVCQQYINTCDADALKPGAIHYDTANRVLQNALSTDAGKSYVKASELDETKRVLKHLLISDDECPGIIQHEIQRLAALKEGAK